MKVILPDSLVLTQNVEYVVDLSTGNKFDFDAACDIGLIDVNSKKYFDTRKNKPLTLFEALEKNYIVMKDELGTNYDEDDVGAYGNARLTKQDLKTLFNPKTGNQIPVQKATELGKKEKFFEILIECFFVSLTFETEKIDRIFFNIENFSKCYIRIEALKNLKTIIVKYYVLRFHFV